MPRWTTEEEQILIDNCAKMDIEQLTVKVRTVRYEFRKPQAVYNKLRTMGLFPKKKETHKKQEGRHHKRR